MHEFTLRVPNISPWGMYLEKLQRLQKVVCDKAEKVAKFEIVLMENWFSFTDNERFARPQAASFQVLGTSDPDQYSIQHYQILRNSSGLEPNKQRNPAGPFIQ